MFEHFKELQSSCGECLSPRTILYSAVFVFFIGFLLRLYRKDARFKKLAKQLPGPRALPFIGNGLDFLRNMDGNMEILKIYEEKYGPMYRLWFGKHLVVVVASLKDLEAVFLSSKILNKPAFMDPAREFWGDSLLTSRMPMWKKTRRGMQPLFAKSAFTEKIPLIGSIVCKYVAQIGERANGAEFDIGKIFPMLSFDVLVEVVFNSSLEYVEKDLTLLDSLMHEADVVFFEKMFKPWLQNPIVDYLLYSKFKAHFKQQTTKFFTKVKNASTLLRNIQYTYEILRNQKTPEIHSNSYGTLESETKSTFIEILYKIQNDLGIGDEYVRDEMINTIAEGTMTASTTLSFCVLMLALHPEIQNKLYEEVNRHFEGTNRRADVEDLDRLPYLDQVLKETERRVPLVQAMFRDIEEDTNIGPYVFPAGTAILIPLSTIHSNPKYYENPDKFDPEHFSSEAVEKRPKLAFMPFGAGPRNCMGKVLAELQMKFTLIALIRLFEFRTTTKMNDLDLLPGVSVTNRNGYRVSVWKRETNVVDEV